MKKQNHTTKTNKSNKSRQTGFSPLLLILIIVIVLALALTGWLIWQRNQQGNNNNQPNANQDSQQPTNNNNPQPTDPTENGKYLVIEEWGVRFELPEELRGGVRYGIETRDGQQIVNFEVDKIAELPGSNCKLIQSESGFVGGLGVFIIRQPGQIPSAETANFVAVHNIESFWYYVAGMRDGCIMLNGSGPISDHEKTTLMVQAADSLEKALKHLESTARR